MSHNDYLKTPQTSSVEDKPTRRLPEKRKLTPDELRTIGMAREGLIEPSEFPPTRPHKRRRKRRLPLDRIIANARKAGVDVAVGPDGSVTFRCSSTAPTKIESNEWDEVFSHGQH